MDFELSEELLAMKEAARDFAQNEIAPHADKWDEEHHFPIDVVRQMGELGLFAGIVQYPVPGYRFIYSSSWY